MTTATIAQAIGQRLGQIFHHERPWECDFTVGYLSPNEPCGIRRVRAWGELLGLNEGLHHVPSAATGPNASLMVPVGGASTRHLRGGDWLAIASPKAGAVLRQTASSFFTGHVLQSITPVKGSYC